MHYLFLFLSFSLFADEYTTITKNIDTPESVLVDQETGTIFVSNVVGAPDQKDGKGWISKGSTTDLTKMDKWVDGIDAPKGMGIHDGHLFVTNIDEIIKINIADGKIETRFKAAGAKFLNDLAITKEGTVYVSDTPGSMIYELDKTATEAKVILKGKKADGPNGLFIHGNDLFVASWGIAAADWSTKIPGTIYKLNLKTKAKTFVVKKPFGNLDGLEMDRDGNFIVSDWMNGDIYKVTMKGKVEKILTKLKNSADIGLEVKTNTIFIPAMSQNIILIKKI